MDSKIILKAILNSIGKSISQVKRVLTEPNKKTNSIEMDFNLIRDEVSFMKNFIKK